MKRLLLFVLIIMGFCGRFASDAKRCPVAQVVVEPVEPLLVRPVQDDMQCRLWVDSVLDRLSLKERVGQLFIYTIAPHQDKSNRELLRKVIEDYKDQGADGRKEYEGTVSWISSEAEFTPKTIQTRDERSNLVYAIKITVRNDGLIKRGMYGDVKL